MHAFPSCQCQPPGAHEHTPQHQQSGKIFAEGNSEIPNQSAKCGRCCGDMCGRCRQWSKIAPPSPYQIDYRNLPIRPLCYSDHSGVAQDSISAPRSLCAECLPESPHTVLRDYPPYRGPALMGKTCFPGRNEYPHRENCLQAHFQPYCQYRDCNDRRRSLLGSPTGSYERARADSVREV